MLPTIIAMVFGGALADRIGHKRTSVVADVLSGLTVAAVPLLYHPVGLPFPALLTLVFLGAIFDAPGGTARQALIPDAAALAQMPLGRVNGTFQVIQSLSILVGPPLAGLLIVFLGESDVLWLDAVTFGASALTIAIFVPAAAAPSQQSSLADVTMGPRFLLGLIALSPPLWLKTQALGFVGFGLTPVNPLIFTLIWERVPADPRARVFGAFIASALQAAPIGVPLADGILASVGVSAVIVGITIGVLLLAGFLPLSPAFRDLDPPAAALSIEGIVQRKGL